MIVRHKLLADLVKLWKNDELVEKIDRLPIELSPRKSKPLGRCCVHKERAVWRYKTFPLMGLDMTDEHDEVTPLSEYARLALSRPEPDKENIMCVIDEACSSCVQINYELERLLLGFGESLVVYQPVKLKERISQKLKKAFNNYNISSE